MPQTNEAIEYDRLLRQGDKLTLRDFNMDAFADGVIAHRNGKGFHENPFGANTLSVRRLSWSYGWNERALQHEGLR